EVLNNKRTMMDILAKNADKSPEQVMKDSDRMFYMNAHEAKDYGIIDRILESPSELPKTPAAIS
ncbi:MAG: ATP-dependent Clp protease proteolytic subunit, partial [Leptolyngbya sp. SIO4C5]|nr:ATP-dependent Clp protease proteolytic subunit [Leptolyngbya sp. SIO4C5]